MISDGKYALYRHFEDKQTKVGTFSIEKGSVVFSDEDAKYNNDQIPEGKLSERTSSMIESYMAKEHNHYLIKKLS